MFLMTSRKISCMLRCLRSRILGSTFPTEHADQVGAEITEATSQLKESRKALDDALTRIKEQPDPFATLVHNFKNSSTRHNARRAK